MSRAGRQRCAGGKRELPRVSSASRAVLHVDELGDVRVIVVVVVSRDELAHLTARALHVNAQGGQVRLRVALSITLNGMKIE